MEPEHTYEAFDKMLPTDFAQQMRKHSRDTFRTFVVSKESITLEVCRYMEHASTVIISDQEKIKDLLAVCEAVEWVEEPPSVCKICPWCKGTQLMGHKGHCPRQLAIAKTKGGD